MPARPRSRRTSSRRPPRRLRPSDAMGALDLDYMLGLVPVLLHYLPLTLAMAAGAMVLALVLAVILAMIRVLRVPGLDQFVKAFVSFFRGTPLLVQLFL